MAQVITGIRVLDRGTGDVEEWDASACGFGYRTSILKREPGRWVVLSVSLALGTDGRGVVRYAELAEALGVEVGGRADVGAIRGAVLALRARKGMVVAPDDPDTWSAGSFFTNPIVDEHTAAAVAAECPRYPAPEGVKLSAAWLIEQSGIHRGFAVSEAARAAISGRHTLALTNRGGASAADIVELARTVRDRVQAHTGIRLVPEPVLVGLEL